MKQQFQNQHSQEEQDFQQFQQHGSACTQMTPVSPQPSETWRMREKNQETLDRLSKWSKEEALLNFNKDKFEVLKYGQKKDLKEDYNYIVDMDDLVQKREETRDLGIIISKNVKLDKHIIEIIKKAKKQSDPLHHYDHTGDH